MMYQPRPTNTNRQADTNKQADVNKQADTDKQSEEEVVFKHFKDGLAIYITIYNTNNNANEESEAGQKAETGGQISGAKGQNANQGGQIAEKCGQNANQDGEVESTKCGACADTPGENDDPAKE